MLRFPSLAAAIASLVAICAWQGIIAYRRYRKNRSTAPAAGDYGPNVIVRRVEISSQFAAEIFERPGGSFGYTLLQRDSDEYGERWILADFSAGSVYDSADRAEAYARQAAGGGG